MQVSNIETTQDATDVNERDAKENLITLPLDNDKLSELQSQDAFCANILTQIKKGISLKGKCLKYKINY